MECLNYDEADEDFAVVIASESDETHCQVTVNRALLKMLSPWWKVKLTCSGFKDRVPQSSCRIVHENPRVAEFALNAARLRVKQADLVSESDLSFAFQVYQLADMWQFDYLSTICQGALQELLTGTDPDTLQAFVTAALERGNDMLEEVLVPFFVDHPTERSPPTYLMFDDNVMLRLAEVAPIAGFQSQDVQFQARLLSYTETCSDEQIVTYLQRNLEARRDTLYLAQSAERCMLLLALAPLAFVEPMVKLVLGSDWSPEQKEVAMSVINFDRVTASDDRYLARHHTELPQQAYVYRALWNCSQTLVRCPYVSMSSSPPYAVFCPKTAFCCDQPDVTAGPLKVVVSGTQTAVFYCETAAYGLRYSQHSWNTSVLQPGLPFSFKKGDRIVIYVS
ncbi:hypothetical protein ABBQ38_011451 [Trebouxia sp. C0009 RCD-2024]